MINCVDSQYTAEYIANVFWRLNLAKVDTITLIPFLKDGTIFNIAYIYIDYWFDREVAYNFIYNLKYGVKEPRLVHYDDEWWPVQFNTHNAGNLNVGIYTTKFDISYFEKPEPIKNRPIEGLQNDYFTVEEAKEYLFYLNQNNYYDKNNYINKEIQHLENELRIHEALQKSHNVSPRFNTDDSQVSDLTYMTHMGEDEWFNQQLIN
jgi:hypothetical protein